MVLLGGFEKATNSVDKNSKKSTGTLDHRKLLSRCEVFQTRVVIAKGVGRKIFRGPIKINPVLTTKHGSFCFNFEGLRESV